MELQKGFNSHALDSRVAVAASESGFVDVVEAGRHEAVIFERTLDPDLQAFLDANKRKMFIYSACSQQVVIDRSDSAFPEAKIETTFPPALKRHLEDRAILLSRVTGHDRMRLLIGNPRVEKFHNHLVPTFVGSLISHGPQWELPNHQPADVPPHHDFFMSRGFVHRSHPIEENEERFIWAYSATNL